MASALSAIDFLATPPDVLPTFVAVFGDEPFLRRLAIGAIRLRVLGDDDAEFSLSTFDGAEAEPREVFDCLATVALFGGGGRMALVEGADDFVRRHRDTLESHAERPPAHGALVLDLASFPSNTRLYKQVVKSGLAIDCKSPPRAALLKWLVGWAKAQHKSKLDRAAADELLDLAGPELGLVDQELAKLAVSVEPGEPITSQLVAQLVGGWRAQTAWDLLDAAAAGNAGEALVQLDRLLLAGEAPIAILAQIGASLRKFAAAARLVELAEKQGRRADLRQALKDAGVKPFVLDKSFEQLRQLGRQRARRLNRWLLTADLALKGASSSPRRGRIVLEELIARLSKAAAATV